VSAVYVLHFTPPFKHARHYIGWTDQEDIAARLDEHVKGKGSRLVKAAVAAGTKIEIAHVLIGADRHFERRIKRRKDVCTWCRICGAKKRPVPKAGK